MYVPPASGAGAHSEPQAPWVEQRPPSVLMAHGLRSNQGRHIPYCFLLRTVVITISTGHF